VLATNAKGSSAPSPYGNGAILPANPAIPSVPAAPNTSVNSNTSVTITWVAPSDGGSAITAYKVAIKNNVGTLTAESINCNVSTTTCTVPISVLQAAPYNLAWGASIYATVLATNLVGSSAESTPGNGALIVTNPDPPILLANSAVITSASVIALTWTAPVVGGGTAVLDYRVSWDKGIGTYVVIASGITTASYSTTSPLAANMVYKFKVESRNAFGFSTSFSNEVSILLPAVLPCTGAIEYSLLPTPSPLYTLNPLPAVPQIYDLATASYVNYFKFAASPTDCL
jgi:hypothetical protein